MVETKTNKYAQNILNSLRAAIMEEFANMEKDVIAMACGHFRHRLETAITAEEGYIEKYICIYVCLSFKRKSVEKYL